METERRLEKKRINVSRQMTVSCLETGMSFSGETYDISDGGIGARLQNAPRTGSNILVSLFWDDLVTPVESFGRVAWTTPLPAGQGIEVGLMLGDGEDANREAEARRRRSRSDRNDQCPVDDDENIETKQTVAAIPMPQSMFDPPPIQLSNGEDLRVSLKGKRSDAVVESISEVGRDGEVKVTLRLTNRELFGYGYTSLSEEEIDSSEWNSNPVRDMLELLANRARPLVGISMTLAGKGGSWAMEGAKWIWSRIPVGWRARTLDALDRLRNGKPKEILSSMGGYLKENVLWRF